MSALTLLALLAIQTPPAPAEIRANAFSGETPSPGYSPLTPKADDGYATTYFTPPWNTTQALTIFATSSTQSGNLGGLEGGRVLCQNLANAVPSLAGTTWYPLLSDSTYNASSLTGTSPSSAPIYNIDGSIIAANRAALWSGGTLTTGVKGTETGAMRYDSVFSGTSALGVKTSSLCSNWTSTSGNGTIGATNDTSSGWIGGFVTSCAVSYRLFCIGNYDPHQSGPLPSPTPTFTSTRTPSPTPSSTPSLAPTTTSTFTPTPGSTPIPPTNSPTRSPTPTTSPTQTPQGSPSPTPSVASVRVQVLIGSTPVPSLPLNIATEQVNTDTRGYAAVTTTRGTSVTIATGLPAVAFTPITGSAGELDGRTVIIDATRLIIPSSDICSVMVGSVAHLWFPYSNIAGTTLQVPLSLHLLNRVLSPSGLAAPAGLFAPGERGNGFALPRSHFESGGSLAGTWQFLATSVSIPSAPLPCAEHGAPATPTVAPNPACVSVDLSAIFTETKRTITTLSQESIEAAHRGEWKPKGSVREPFLRGGALALKKMRSTLREMGGNPQSCATPPSGTTCSMKTINKPAIKKNFALIFSKPLPPGLGRVKRLIPGEVARFSRVIDALPSPLYSCP